MEGYKQPTNDINSGAMEVFNPIKIGARFDTLSSLFLWRVMEI